MNLSSFRCKSKFSNSQILDMSEDYTSIDKSQLISMIHFLEKRDEEQKQENMELKELIKELQETHHQKMKSQADLLDSIDRLTK